MPPPCQSGVFLVYIILRLPETKEKTLHNAECYALQGIYAHRNGGRHRRRRAAHASISGIDAVSVHYSLVVTAALVHPAGTGRQRSNILDPAGEYAWLPGVDLPLQRRRVFPKLAAEFINACRGDMAMVTDTYAHVGKLALMMWGARQKRQTLEVS